MAGILIGFLITMGLLVVFSGSAIFASIFGYKKINNKVRGHGKAFRKGEKALASQKDESNEMKKFDEQENRERVAAMSYEEKQQLKKERAEKESKAKQEQEAKQEKSNKKEKKVVVKATKEEKKAQKLAKHKEKVANKISVLQNELNGVKEDKKQEKVVEDKEVSVRSENVAKTTENNTSTLEEKGKAFVIPQYKEEKVEEEKFVIPQIQEDKKKTEEELSLDYLKSLINKNSKKSNAYFDISNENDEETK